VTRLWRIVVENGEGRSQKLGVSWDGLAGEFGGDVGVDEGFEGDGEFVVGAFEVTSFLPSM